MGRSFWTIVARGSGRYPLYTLGAAISLLASCAASGPNDSGARSAPAAARPAQPSEEKVSEGQSTLTVLSRPGDDRAKPPPEPKAPPPLTDEACRERPACAERGECTAAGQTCVARSYTDCERMTACVGGRCAFKDGHCGPVDSCRDAQVCAGSGRCRNEGDRCVAGDGADCKAAKACRDEGLCSLRGQDCLASAATDCRRALACSQGGRCSVRDGVCRAEQDSQCRRSEGCRTQGACLARGGVCVKSCRESDACRNEGRCGDVPPTAGAEGRCVAVSDGDCRKASRCAALGLCSMSVGGHCEAGDDVECRQSKSCGEQGLCTAKRGRCVPASKAECAQATVACKRDGRCNYVAGRCVR